MNDPTHSQTSPSPASSSDSTAQDWSNYWQGRTAQDAGAALVGVGVETSAELADIWSRELITAKGPLLDIACGAGTVLRAALSLGKLPLHGIDISRDALVALEREVPDAKTSVADAAALPFADGSFATVTSQFGIEYADRKAFAEAMRVLEPGGRFIAICHHAGGAIASEVRGKRDAVVALEASEFIPLAKAVFRADDVAFPAAAKAFGPAQDEVLARARAGDALAQHLYTGTQALHTKRASYALADIEGWLDGMAKQIAAFRGRMESMLSAALDPAEAKTLASEIDANLSPISLGGSDAAWLLSAQKA